MADGNRKKVLLVDDEPKILQGLERVLQVFADHWQIASVASGEKALEHLAREPVDVVVSDWKMPGMDGLQLLHEVSQRFPGAVRILVASDLDDDGTRLVDLPHHFVSKQCQPNELRETVDRAWALQELLTDARLKRSVSQIRTLPTLPSLYKDLMAELRKEEPSLECVGEIVSRDIGMSAKMLKLINSAFFGLPREVTTPGEAVMFLGVETIKALALSLQVFSQFKGVTNFSVEALWNHSWVTGVLAKQIAASCDAPKAVVDQSFVSGLMHDVGKLVLASGLREQFQGALALSAEKRIPFEQAERDIYGATHAEVGAYLLGLWKLPNCVIEALAFHHCPKDSRATSFLPLAAVHIANVLDHEQRHTPGEAPRSQFDVPYLETLGLSGKLNDWRGTRSEAA